MAIEYREWREGDRVICTKLGRSPFPVGTYFAIIEPISGWFTPTSGR